MNVATGPARGTYSEAHFTADLLTRKCTGFCHFRGNKISAG